MPYALIIFRYIFLNKLSFFILCYRNCFTLSILIVQKIGGYITERVQLKLIMPKAFAITDFLPNLLAEVCMQASEILEACLLY